MTDISEYMFFLGRQIMPPWVEAPIPPLPFDVHAFNPLFVIDILISPEHMESKYTFVQGWRDHG